MDQSVLTVDGLRVSVEGCDVLSGLDITVKKGSVHAVMGPNGSGKSTLAYTLAGHPSYEATRGSAHLNGEDLLEMDADERAQAGLFLAFQYPLAVPGLKMEPFLHSAVRAVRGEEEAGDVFSFHRRLLKELRFLDMDPTFAERYVNDGFSGGEKKRAEILQMLLLKPKLAILDETDSGLDIDAIGIVAKGVNRLRDEGMSILIITHYQRILNFIKPDTVSVLHKGKIVRTGGPELALELEEKGYGEYTGPSLGVLA
ncbi:Fe-S cluster assembly ATPase SufC [bacterium]|nr:Fe-S cluster assembly ATPase SufC [bacterium]